MKRKKIIIPLAIIGLVIILFIFIQQIFIAITIPGYKDSFQNNATFKFCNKIDKVKLTIYGGCDGFCNQITDTKCSVKYKFPRAAEKAKCYVSMPSVIGDYPCNDCIIECESP